MVDKATTEPSNQRPPARGEPYPFTQEQVDALVRGEPEQQAIRNLLRSQPSDVPPSASPSGARGTPVPVSREELSQLQTRGALPVLLRDRIRQTGAPEPTPRARARRKLRPDRRPAQQPSRLPDGS